MTFEEALTDARDDQRDNWESYKREIARSSMSKDFRKLNTELGAEFHRYVAEHPAWAQSISRLERKSLCRWRTRGLQYRESSACLAYADENRPVVVCIGKLAPVGSRIIKQLF